MPAPRVPPRNAAEAAAERECLVRSPRTSTSANEVLLAACCESDGVSAVAILENGASEAVLNCVSPVDSYTPLMLAIQQRCTPAITLLLQDERVKINHAATNGQTALSVAAGGGHATNVKLLLARGATPYKASEEIVPPIFMAAQLGHPDCAKLLIAAHARVDELEPEASVSAGFALVSVGVARTALHIASCNGHLNVLTVLLRVGADVTAVTSREGATALFYASEHGHADCVALLLEAARRRLLSAASQRRHVDAGKLSGQTPLYIAAKNGHAACVQQLLEERADPNIPRTHDGMSPLIMAAHGGHTDVVHALLDASADTAATTSRTVRTETGVTRAGLTALQAATTNGHAACARLICARVERDESPSAGSLATGPLQPRHGARTEIDVALNTALDTFLEREAESHRDTLTDRLASGVDDVCSLLWRMLPPGRQVILAGLQARPELNGECAVVQQQEPGGERCAVSVDVGGGGLQDIRVKLANLRPEGTGRGTGRGTERGTGRGTGQDTGQDTGQRAGAPVGRSSFIPRMISDSGALERAQDGMIGDLAKRMNGTLDAYTAKLRGMVRDIVVQGGALTPEEIWTVFISKLVEVEGSSAAALEKQLEQWALIEPVANQILYEVYPDRFADPGSTVGGGAVDSPPAGVDGGPGTPQTASDIAANDSTIRSVLASSDATLEDVSAVLALYEGDASSDAITELKRLHARLKKKQKKERQRQRRQQDESGAQGVADRSGPSTSSAIAAAEPPDEFMCPITHEVMEDPVVAADGHTYERAAIERWVAKKLMSPKTGGALGSATIFPNHSIRSQIREWQEKQSPG